MANDLSRLRISDVVLMGILGSVLTVMPMSTDLYLPALPAIAVDLQVQPGAVQFTMAVFMLGGALGTLIYGPVTDAYGPSDRC